MWLITMDVDTLLSEKFGGSSLKRKKSLIPHAKDSIGIFAAILLRHCMVNGYSYDSLVNAVLCC